MYIIYLYISLHVIQKCNKSLRDENASLLTIEKEKLKL